MAIEPLLDQGVKIGEGLGGLLALPLVQAAAALAAELPEVPEEKDLEETGPGQAGAEDLDIAARDDDAQPGSPA